jgi:hypothetical protein
MIPAKTAGCKLGDTDCKFVGPRAGEDRGDMDSRENADAIAVGRNDPMATGRKGTLADETDAGAATPRARRNTQVTGCEIESRTIATTLSGSRQRSKLRPSICQHA